MPHPWIEFMKQWAQTHNMTYSASLSDPNMREAYYASKQQKPKRVRKPTVTV